MLQRQIVLDTETTGFYHSAEENPDRLIEFAGLELIDREVSNRYLHLYVHPERDIPADAAKIHGITLDKLAGKPVFAQVAKQIAEFIRGAELIIHNAKFDVGFLNAEFARCGLPSVQELGCSITDTLEMARQRYPGQKNNLDVLCNRLGVDRSKRVLHGALIDCELLAEVYLSMTRVQYSLVDDEETQETTPVVAQQQTTVANHQVVDLCVLKADECERNAHEAYLDGLDKECKTGSLYRKEIIDSNE